MSVNGFYNLVPIYPPSFVGRNLSFVTGFTHRTNITYLELLMELYKWLRDIHIPEIDKILEEFRDKYENDFEQLKVDIESAKNDWQKFFNEFIENVTNEIAELNDVAVSRLIANEGISETSKELSKRLTYVNVLRYGVIGDGVTDNTEALQKIVEMPNVGCLYFPAGKYIVKDNVYLRSGVSDGLRFTGDGDKSVIKKSSGSTNYCVFVGLSGTKTGYGSGVKNIKFDHLKFEGDLANGVSLSAFSANRASGVVVENCTFSQCSQNGHVFDLMGCENVFIRNNKFGGIKPITGREYTEAIQVDSSLRSGAGFPVPDGEFFDGLACRNIRVVDNVFQNETINGVSYAAQIPFGSHSWVDGKPHHNLFFDDNTVDGAIDSAGSSFPGIVHFFGCKDSYVRRNIIRNTKAAFVRFMGGSSAHKPENADLANSPLSPATYPQQGENVEISGNRVYGVTASNPLIWGYGTATLKLKDIRVNGNLFKNCNSVAESYIIQMTHHESFEMVGNEFVGCKGSPLFCENTARLNFTDNVGDGGEYFPVNISLVNKVYSERNKFRNYARQMNFVECAEVVVTHNEVTVNGDLAAIRCTTSPSRDKFVKIVGNDVAYLGSTPYDESPGIYVDTDYLSGVCVGNVSKNYTKASFAPVGVESIANVVA